MCEQIVKFSVPLARALAFFLSAKNSFRDHFLYRFSNQFAVLPAQFSKRGLQILLLPRKEYSLRNQDVVGQILARTEKFQSSFYPNCLTEWNNLDHEIRLGPSVAAFKKKLLAIIRPPAKPVLVFTTQLAYPILLNLGLVSVN